LIVLEKILNTNVLADIADMQITCERTGS